MIVSLFMLALSPASCPLVCGGTPEACADFTNAADCADRSAIGCVWSPNGACTGTATACADLPLSDCMNTDSSAAATASNHGCYQAGNCNLGADCSTYDASQTACTTNACTWNPSVCPSDVQVACDINGFCFGPGPPTHLALLPGCSATAVGSQTVDCGSYPSPACPPGCSLGAFLGDVCTSTGPVPCTVDDFMNGVAGCLTAATACGGTTPCSSLAGAGDGGTADGCLQNEPGCVMTATTCTDPGRTCAGLSASACTGYCTWTTSGCQTLPAGGLVCGALNENDCSAEARGCSWSDNSTCSGGSAVCSSVAIDVCGTASAPGCEAQCSAVNLGDEDFRGGACRTAGPSNLVAVALAIFLWQARRRADKKVG